MRVRYLQLRSDDRSGGRRAGRRRGRDAAHGDRPYESILTTGWGPARRRSERSMFWVGSSTEGAVLTCGHSDDVSPETTPSTRRQVVDTLIKFAEAVQDGSVAFPRVRSGPFSSPSRIYRRSGPLRHAPRWPLHRSVGGPQPRQDGKTRVLPDDNLQVELVDDVLGVVTGEERASDLGRGARIVSPPGRPSCRRSRQGAP